MSQSPTPPQHPGHPQQAGWQPPATAYRPPLGTHAPQPWQEPPRSPVLGVVALALSIAAAGGATILSAITGFFAAEGAMRRAVGISPQGLENFAPDQLFGLLSPVRDLVLWAEIGLWAGTVLGVWALAQGIVAVASRRGRGQGIAAIVIAALGPIVYFLVVYAMIAGGIVAGAGHWSP